MKTDELSVQAKILEIKAKWFNCINERANQTTEFYEGYGDRFFELQGMFKDAENELKVYRDKVKTIKSKPHEAI